MVGLALQDLPALPAPRGPPGADGLEGPPGPAGPGIAKTDIQQIVEETTCGPREFCTKVAQCADDNDIALSGLCDSETTKHMTLYDSITSNNATESFHRCSYFNTLFSDDRTFKTGVNCLVVP